MTEQSNDKFEKQVVAPAANSANNNPHGATLFRSIRFHSAIVTALFVFMLLIMLAAFKTGGDLSFVFLLFLSGGLGGVLNTYMRLRGIPTNEQELSSPVTNKLAIIQVYMSPIIAGAFGFVFYGLFVSGIIQGSLFPAFLGTDEKYQGVVGLFSVVTPATQLDAARALFWAFVAGFSERLVPNILDRLAKEGGETSPPPTEENA